MNQPILITGTSGLLGANLVLALQARGHEIIAVSRRHTLHGKGIHAYTADLCDPTVSLPLVLDNHPSWVVHCAALTNLDYCQSHPDEAVRNNADMARIMAEAARKAGARFLYISTDSVFDGTRGNYTERDGPHPINHYADSKWQGEKMVAAANPETLIVRVNIYGWNAQKKQSLAEWILTQLKASTPFPGFQDVVFNPLLVNDVSDMLIRMIEANPPLRGTFHIGSRDTCSKYEFARALATVFGYDPALVQPSSSDTVAFKAPRPKVTTLDTSKIEKILAIQMPGLMQGLERFRRFEKDGSLESLRKLIE